MLKLGYKGITGPSRIFPSLYLTLKEKPKTFVSGIAIDANVLLSFVLYKEKTGAGCEVAGLDSGVRDN